MEEFERRKMFERSGLRCSKDCWKSLGWDDREGRIDLGPLSRVGFGSSSTVGEDSPRARLKFRVSRGELERN